jgi:small subunit ribosomal protein S2
VTLGLLCSDQVEEKQKEQIMSEEKIVEKAEVSATEDKEIKKPRPHKEQLKTSISERVVTMRQLLETGVHFGHQTRRWNPKMAPYIYTSRNDIHVIDLQKTLGYINKAYDYIKEEVSKGATVLFVGTKKQAQAAIEEEAKRCEMPYISNRWLGGMLTNFETIKKSIKRMEEIESWKVSGLFDAFVTKEQSVLNKKLSKLHYHFDGIKDMKQLPDIIFIVDTKKEEIAVHEANVLKMPIVGVVDTNCDPDLVNHPIPANDDAIRTIKLLVSIVANAIIEGKKSRLSAEDAITLEVEEVFVKGAVVEDTIKEKIVDIKLEVEDFLVVEDDEVVI